MSDCNNSDNTRSSETSTPISDIIKRNLAMIVNDSDFIDSIKNPPTSLINQSKNTKSDDNDLFNKVMRFLDIADMFSKVGAIESIQVTPNNEKKAVKKDANLKENYHTIQ